MDSLSNVNNNYPNYNLYNAWDAFEPEARERNRERQNTVERVEYAPNLYSSVNFTNKPAAKKETRTASPQPRTYGRDSMAQYGFYEDPYPECQQKPVIRRIIEEPVEPPVPKTVKVGMIVCRNNVENDNLYAENVNRDLGEGFGMPGMDFGAMGFNAGGANSDYAEDVNQDTGRGMGYGIGGMHGMGGLGFDMRGSNNRRVYNRGMAFPHQTTQSLIPEPGSEIMQAIQETIQGDRSMPKVGLPPQNPPVSSTSVPAQNIKRTSNMSSRSATTLQSSKSADSTRKARSRESRSQERKSRSPPRSESEKRNSRSSSGNYIRSYNNPTRTRTSSSVPREAVYNSNTPVIQANYNPRRLSNKNGQNSKDKKPGLLWRGLSYPFKAIGISK